MAFATKDNPAITDGVMDGDTPETEDIADAGLVSGTCTWSWIDCALFDEESALCLDDWIGLRTGFPLTLYVW